MIQGDRHKQYTVHTRLKSGYPFCINTLTGKHGGTDTRQYLTSTEPSLRGRLLPLRFAPAARPVSTFPPLQPVLPRLAFLFDRVVLPSEKLSFLPIAPPAEPVDKGEAAATAASAAAVAAAAVCLPGAGLAGVLA